MRKNNYILLLLIFTIGSGCSKINDFLDVPPSKNAAVEIKTIEQLEQLLNGFQRGTNASPAAFFNEESNLSTTYGTDDFYLSTDLYNARPGTFNMTTIHYMLWDTDYLPENISSTNDRQWNAEYRKIFYANTVLAYIDEVSGGTAEQKANLRADAHFVRAYSYWVLANTYCLPYTEATRNEPGLPIKQTISFEENAARQPLHVVYELIEADLAEALKTTVPLVQEGKPHHWRASTAGVHGFAARYWLNRFDYTKAIEHAELALAEYNRLVDYNTEMRYGNAQTVTLNAGTAQQSSFTIQYPYTHDNQTDYTDIIGWKEFLYFRTLANGNWWYIPSPALLALYNQDDDLRYKYHIVEGYSYDRGMTQPAYAYPAYVFFYKDRIPSGPTVAEMLLIKAEALAHTGNATGAMAALNTLRAKRITPGPGVKLTAVNRADAIQKVAEERRREMPFVQRWTDLRRYNNNEYAGDDITLNKTFYPYTLSSVNSDQPSRNYTIDPSSRRWAAPIPITEIVASKEVINQNTY